MRVSKIYVASSWRNERQQQVVSFLRESGYLVYDFRGTEQSVHYVPKTVGFQWSEIDKEWQDWSPKFFSKMLSHTIAEQGFLSDFEAMKWADAFVLVAPCGISAHLELGWACGARKRTIVLLDRYQVGFEPELMYKLADVILFELKELPYALNLQPINEALTPEQKNLLAHALAQISS